MDGAEEWRKRSPQTDGGAAIDPQLVVSALRSKRDRLRRLNAQQSSDFYEIVIERHRRASTIVTSSRTIDQWIPLFDDPILAQSALDRLAHNAYQIIMEGESYRSRQRPGFHPTPLPRKRRR